MMMLTLNQSTADRFHPFSVFTDDGIIHPAKTLWHVAIVFNAEPLGRRCLQLQHHVRVIHKSRLNNMTNSFFTALDSADLQIDAVCQDLHHLHSHNEDREERSLLAILAGSVLSLVGIGDLLYLHSQVHDLHVQEKHLLHILRSEDHNLHLINNRMDIINSTVHSVVQELLRTETATQAERFVLLLLNLIQDLRVDIDNVLLCLLTTQRDHRLHPSFLTPQQRHQILQHGRLVAAKLKLRLPFTDNAAILNVPASYTVTGSIITFFVHLPLTSQTSFRLWKLLPFPIQMSPNATRFHVASRHHAIAVNQAGEHLEFSQTELANCLTIEEQYFCPATALMTSYNSTCLGRLFRGATSFLDLCDTHITQSTWQLKLTPAGLYSFSAFPRTVDAWYSNGSVVVLPWEGYTFWSTQNCTLKSELFAIEHLPYARSSMKIYAAPFQLVSRPNSSAATEELLMLQKKLEQLLPAQVKTHLSQINSVDWLAVSIIISAVCFLCGCICCATVYYLHKKRKERRMTKRAQDLLNLKTES